MAGANRTTVEPLDIFDLRCELERIEWLFSYIRTQNTHAEDAEPHSDVSGACHAAIDALAGKGLQDCQDLGRRIERMVKAMKERR